MTKMFEPQLGKNIVVYINDMVVKSKVESEHINDFRDIFEILRKHKLCLNASKCSFDVGSGKFLGYMVIHRGIEVDPNQIRAINNLQPPRNPKELQGTCCPSSEKININFVSEIVNFGSPNLIILKKKFKNITKYHNIFTISSFLGSE